MTLDHPEKVAQGRDPRHRARSTHLFNHVTQKWATGSYHWFFMIQPFDLPERLMGADPDYFISKKLAKTEQGLSFFGKAALAEYMRCFRNPATIHAMCEDYRATAGVDLGMDTVDFAAGRRIETPLLRVVGRDRRGRAPAEAGRGVEGLRRQHPRRRGAALRALPLGRSAGGDLSRAPRLLRGAVAWPRTLRRSPK